MNVPVYRAKMELCVGMKLTNSLVIVPVDGMVHYVIKVGLRYCGGRMREWGEVMMGMIERRGESGGRGMSDYLTKMKCVGMRCLAQWIVWYIVRLGGGEEVGGCQIISQK